MDKFTVGDLKTLLQTVPDTLLVAAAGHYGEAILASKYDFGVQQLAYNYDSSDTEMMFVIASLCTCPEPD